MLDDTKCGQAYTGVCEADSEGNCNAKCVTKKLDDALDYPHVICTTDGEWVDSQTLPESQDPSSVTYASTDEFKCAYELY